MSWRYGLILVVLLVFVSAIACNESDETDPQRQCNTSADCGPGYKCELGACIQVIDGDDPITDGDPDQVIVDGDLDAEPDTEPDLVDTADQVVDGDTTENVEQSENDQEVQNPCLGDDLDPECGDFFSQVYCRSGQVQHDVNLCHNGALYRCFQRFDCAHPTCGYYTTEALLRHCPDDQCVTNDDPEQDDYCSDEPPTEEDGDLIQPDGDLDIDVEGDLDVDNKPPNHADGFPCSTSADCLPDHACQLDYDDIGRYCAPNSSVCVYHVGMESTESAIIYQQGATICNEGDTGYRRCLRGNWLAETLCPVEQCVEEYKLWSGQSCQDSVGCVPTPRPDPVPCADGYRCLDDYTCRTSCTVSTQCQEGYICIGDNPDERECVILE